MRLGEGSCGVTAVWRNEWPAEAMSSVTNYSGKHGYFNVEWRHCTQKCGFAFLTSSLDFWWILCFYSVLCCFWIFRLKLVRMREMRKSRESIGDVWLHFSVQLTAHSLPKRTGEGGGRRDKKGKLERKIKQVDRTYVKGKIDWSVLLKWADWKIVGRDTHTHIERESRRMKDLVFVPVHVGVQTHTYIRLP